MPNQKITLACVLEDDGHLSIKLEQNLSDHNQSDQELTERWVSHAIEATHEVVNGIMHSRGVSQVNRLLTAGQIWVVSVENNYLNNLKDEQTNHGDEGVRDNAVAVAQTIGSVFADTVVDKAVTIFTRNIAAGVAAGVIASEAYERKFFDDGTKSAKEKLGDFTRDLFPHRSSKPQIAIESTVADDVSQTQTQTYRLTDQANADGVYVAGKGSNIVQGNSADNTYYFPDFSGENIISNLSGNAKLVLGNGRQSVIINGNAEPKTDAANNAIPNSWTLAGFEFRKSASASLFNQKI